MYMYVGREGSGVWVIVQQLKDVNTNIIEKYSVGYIEHVVWYGVVKSTSSG